MIDKLLVYILLSMATASISLTITRTYAFEWLRDLLNRIPYIGKLFSCSYCMSHYISFGLVFEYLNNGFLYKFIYSFAVIGLSAILIGFIYNSMSNME